MHAEVPVASALYAPAAQVKHTTDAGTATSEVKVPSRQKVHAEEPEDSALYRPCTHAMQAADVNAVAA